MIIFNHTANWFILLISNRYIIQPVKHGCWCRIIPQAHTRVLWTMIIVKPWNEILANFIQWFIVLIVQQHWYGTCGMIHLLTVNSSITMCMMPYKYEYEIILLCTHYNLYDFTHYINKWTWIFDHTLPSNIQEEYAALHQRRPHQHLPHHRQEHSVQGAEQISGYYRPGYLY